MFSLSNEITLNGALGVGSRFKQMICQIRDIVISYVDVNLCRDEWQHDWLADEMNGK